MLLKERRKTAEFLPKTQTKDDRLVAQWRAALGCDRSTITEDVTVYIAQDQYMLSVKMRRIGDSATTYITHRLNERSFARTILGVEPVTTDAVEEIMDRHLEEIGNIVELRGRAEDMDRQYIERVHESIRRRTEIQINRSQNPVYEIGSTRGYLMRGQLSVDVNTTVPEQAQTPRLTPFENETTAANPWVGGIDYGTGAGRANIQLSAYHHRPQTPFSNGIPYQDITPDEE